jgi:hypothetical protein
MSRQRDQLDRVELNTGANVIQRANVNDEWKLTRPLAARADSTAVDGVVGRIETAQMKSIVTNEASAADLKKYGLDKPALSGTLNRGSARATLLIGGKAGEEDVYARDASKPLVATVEKGLADDLKKGAEDYRRKDLFAFRAFNATHIEFTRDGKTVAFDREKAKEDTKPDLWKRVSPTLADADKDKIEALLTGLADIRATSFTDSRAKTGLDAPVLTVDAKFDDGKKEERVSFGRDGKDVYAATVDPGAAKIEASRLDEAIKTLNELSK